MMKDIIKTGQKYNIYVDVLRTIIRFGELIDLMKNNKIRKQLSFRVISKKLGYSTRTIEKMVKTMLLFGVPMYRHPLKGRQLIDSDYELQITPTMCKVLLNNLNAKSNVSLTNNI